MDSNNDSDDSAGSAFADGSDFSSDEDSSESSEEELYGEDLFFRDLQRIRDNNPYMKRLTWDGRIGDYAYADFIQNITNEGWEEIGRDISNITHLKKLQISDGTLNDDTASFLFRGLTRSTSIKVLSLHYNDLSERSVRNMVPFLQNSNSLRRLTLDGNDVQSEGFNMLLRALRDSRIKELSCNRCGIDSIEIDIDRFPKQLKNLHLWGNNINADGCGEIAKLLHGEDSTLTWLDLSDNNIDDDGVAILVNALQSNTALMHLGLRRNRDISVRGHLMLLKLVNDISSIKATLQSNHTLGSINLDDIQQNRIAGDFTIEQFIYTATEINRESGYNPDAAGREKVIWMQLHSVVRPTLAELQGVNKSVFSEINPLHLPEVLSLVGRRHGQGEFYVSLKSSIAGVISTVNRRQCIRQQLAYHEAIIAEHAAKSAELRAELGELDVSDGDAVHVGNKRRRKWWWGIWGGTSS